MAELFLSIVNMSISACWLVLAVLLLRLVLKKAPKWIICLLWGFAGLRLVMPFSLESIFSLIPSAETVSPEIMTDTNPSVNTGIPALNNTINPVISDSFAPEIGASANPLQILVPIAAAVWLVGMAALLIYTLVSFLRLKKKIGTAVLLRDNIYQSENVASPFVLGIIKPKIYLPFNMNERDVQLVIAHENAHIKRKDHLWKPLGFLILTLHWFNPLVWLGYVLLCRDIELACDERVIKGLDNVQRADYSQALLTCSVNRRSVAACPLAFGEVSVKDRVKSALSYKKPAFWVVVVAVVASVAVAVCFLTNPKKDKEYYDPGYSVQVLDETYIGTTQLPEKTDTYYFDVLNGTKGKLSNGARFEITECNLQQGKLTVKLSGAALYSTTEVEPVVVKKIVVEEGSDGVVLTDKQYTHFYTFSFVRTQSLDEAENAKTLKEDFERIVAEKESIKTKSNLEYSATVRGLINQLDTACLSALQNEKQYYEYYVALKEASSFATRAYEDFVVCKYQSGSIGATLISAYEFSVQKQITQNIISLLDGTGTYYQIEFSFSRLEQDSEYFKQISILSKQIYNCTSNDEAERISTNLDTLIASMKSEAEFEVGQVYSGLDDDMNEMLLQYFYNMISSLEHFQEQNSKALELIDCGGNFACCSQLFSKLEMAIFLCNLI